MSGPRNLVFDLDGTLVDSSPGVLQSLAHALEERGIAPRVPLAPSLIGPTLDQIIARLTGSSDRELRQALAQAFKAHYDRQGCLHTRAYPSVVKGMPILASHQALFVVTNKREAPTLRILDHLGIRTCFTEILCVATDIPAMSTKSALLDRLAETRGLCASDTWCVGDSAEDAQACSKHGFPFVFAAYGYGSAPEASRATLTIQSFQELLDALERAATPLQP